MNYKGLIEKYGTPLYLYDATELTHRVNYLKSKLDASYKLIFAIKANTFILSEIDNFVDGYEICSYGEYDICNKLNLDVDKFVISGVSKKEKEIEDILYNGVKKFTIESLNQYKLLNELTKKHNVKINVLIRLTSGNQFGVSEDDFIEIVQFNNNNDNIKIIGIEYFTGTQKHSIKKINREIDYLIQFINMLKEKYDIELEEVEYGPGLPVFYFEEDSFDEEMFFEELGMALSKIKNKKISLEVGRSIAASCGKYLTSIVDMKKNELGNTILLDGGINHIVYYGQTMAMRKPFYDVYPIRETNVNTYNLYGSLCTVNDVIVKNIELNKPEIGDIIVFKNVGAYSVTEGISLFLSRELPKVIIRDRNGNDHLVRNNIKTSEINFPNYDVEEYEV